MILSIYYYVEGNSVPVLFYIPSLCNSFRTLTTMGTSPSTEVLSTTTTVDPKNEEAFGENSLEVVTLWLLIRAIGDQEPCLVAIIRASVAVPMRLPRVSRPKRSLCEHMQPCHFLFKLLLVGDSGVGRSALLEQFAIKEEYVAWRFKGQEFKIGKQSGWPNPPASSFHFEVTRGWLAGRYVPTVQPNAPPLTVAVHSKMQIHVHFHMHTQ
jgi:hypothetical protein